MLVTGEQTDGRYCLIEMRVPDGGGPPPHRHDFEEMFTILEGEIEFTFRGEKHTVRAGSTINVPANAPHNFRNVSGAPDDLRQQRWAMEQITAAPLFDGNVTRAFNSVSYMLRHPATLADPELLAKAVAANEGAMAT
jgi:uncharacterized cupin superfamily protein